MNRKQLTILVVVGLLVGGLGWMISQRRAATWTRGSENASSRSVLGDFPINDVTHIVIKQPAGELNLVKGDIWQVKERYNYPASFSEVGDLLRKASDLKSVQTPKVGPSQLGRLELLPPEKDKTNTGTLIEFKGKDEKAIKSLLLGKKAMREGRNDSPFGGGGGYPVGRYVMVPGSQNVAVVSETFSELEGKPERWLSKDFFKVEKLKSIAITAPVATNSWKIARDSEAGSWSLVDKKEGEPVETNKLSTVGYALSSPGFNDVLAPDTKPETIGLDKPLVATLETFDHFTYTIRVGSKTNDDNYPLAVAVTASLVKERTPEKDEKPEDKEKRDKEFKEKLQKLEEKLKNEKNLEHWTYLVSKWTIDPLLKERKEFLTEKKPEENKDTASTPPPVVTPPAGLPLPPLPNLGK